MKIVVIGGALVALACSTMTRANTLDFKYVGYGGTASWVQNSQPGQPTPFGLYNQYLRVAVSNGLFNDGGQNGSVPFTYLQWSVYSSVDQFLIGPTGFYGDFLNDLTSGTIYQQLSSTLLFSSGTYQMEFGRLTISAPYIPPPPPSVPEPATWAMLLLGVGLLGAFQRRRGDLRRVAASEK